MADSGEIGELALSTYCVEKPVQKLARSRYAALTLSTGTNAMMGRSGGAQEHLFYSFNLDDHVSADHLLRGTDRFLDLNDLRRHLSLLQSHWRAVGRPRADDWNADRRLLLRHSL